MGDVKYLRNGSAVEVEAEIDGKFLVRKVFQNHDYDEGDEEYFTSDTLSLVDKIFDNAPTEMLDKNIADLEGIIATLRIERDELGAKLNADKKAYESQLKKFASNAALQKIVDFMEGKITHYVKNEYGYDILTAEEALKYVDGTRERGLKLITLFGMEKDNYAWRVNEYGDGSGGWTTLIPCSSYEEACSCLQNIFNALPLRQWGYVKEIECARKFGLTFPQPLIDHTNEMVLKGIKSAIEKSKATTQEYEKTLSDHLAQQA